MRQSKLVRSIVCWLLLSPLIVVTVFPFAVMFLTAVKPRTEVLSPTWWPSEFHWQNFSDMWVATGFGRALANSLYVSAIATVGAILISIPAAYAMSRFRFAGYGAQVATPDALKSAAVTIGGTLALALALMWAMARYGNNDYLKAFLAVSWLMPLILSQLYRDLKGRSGSVQAVVIGGQMAIVMAIVVTAVWLTNS